MAALSDHAEKLILDWMMTAGTAARPSAWYVALYTAAPSDAGGGTELSGVVIFTADGGDWGSVTHMGIHDASSGGNLLWHGSLAAAKTVADGDTLEFAVGNIDLTVA
jgi:hypothetical protein